MGTRRKRGKKPRFYEPVTENQLWKIMAVAEENGWSEERVNALVRKIAGIGITTALSKMEAAFVIERIIGGKVLQMKPFPQRTAERIGNVDCLPYMGHIKGIREAMAFKRWTPQYIREFLSRFYHVGTIRELNRDQAKSCFMLMQNIVTWKYKGKL